MSVIRNKTDLLFWSVILLFILIQSFTTQITTDYAWYIKNIDWYINDHTFYDSVLNVNLWWGGLFVALNAQIVKLFGIFYINYWLLSLVYSLLGIFVLYRFLKLMNNNTLDIYIAILTYILLTFPTKIYIGTRPETIYGTSLVIVLYLLFKFNQSNDYKLIYLSSFIATIGALSHPNGLVLYVILLIFALKFSITKNLKYSHIVINVLIIGFIFTYGITFSSSLDDLFSSFSTIFNDPNHSIPFYKEYKRYDYFITFFPLVKPIFFFSLATLIIYIVNYVLIKKDYFYENFISISVIFVFIYLTLVGAKWVYYFALLFPFMSISVHIFLKNTLTCILCKKIIFLYGIVLLFIVVERNIYTNEEFTKFLFPNKENIITINNIKKTLSNKKIYAPIRLYAMLHQNKLFIPLENKQPKVDGIEFVILHAGHNYKKYEKRLDITLIHQIDFSYNTYSYSIYRISSGNR